MEHGAHYIGTGLPTMQKVNFFSYNGHTILELFFFFFLLFLGFNSMLATSVVQFKI